MIRPNALIALLAIFAFTSPVLAQRGAAKPAAKPAMTAAPAPAPKQMTAEEVIARSLKASGSASAKHTTLIMKGKITIPNQGIDGTIEIYSKAPNKQVTSTNLAGMLLSKQGFDGEKAWSSDTMQGKRMLEGVEAAVLRRGAIFNADAQWRTIWASVALATPVQVDGRDTYAVTFTAKPGEGSPLTVYYDATTFLPLRSDTVLDGPTGTMPITTFMTDYRDVQGLKLPFTMTQQVPMIAMKVTFDSIVFDTPIDDSMFVMPAK